MGIINLCSKSFIIDEETSTRENTLVTSGKSMLLEVIKNKKSIVDMEYSVKYQDRKYYFINSGYPFFGDDGNFLGAIDIFRSMERTKRLANAMAGYQADISFEDIVCKSSIMEETINLAKLFAKSGETVLILGESGVGKELFAQSIHRYSDRRDGPFIALNCANFVNDLIDSELFGYDSGAFTGASKGGKLGKFMLADGGTIFLDEIGEMPIHLQSKLLRVLENYDWPGNIRELENTISRILFTCTDEEYIETLTVTNTGIGKLSEASTLHTHNKNIQINKESLPIFSSKREPLSITYDEFEAAYAHCNSNKKKTAEYIGISRPTLYKLLKKYNL